MQNRKFCLAAVALSMLAVGLATAQKARLKPAAKAKPIIFAVLNDGGMLEPIGYIEKGKLTPTVVGGEDEAKLASFGRSYYKTGSAYRLIFGGADAGTVTIKSFDAKMECSSNMARASYSSPRAKLKGNVMALATNAPAAKKGSGVRRLPTAAERAEIEALVRAELARQKVSAAAVKNLRYQNLTALDVDADGKIEFVGSYWVETDAASRAILFFVAGKGEDGKYSIGYSKFENVDQKDVMSKDIKDVDSGVYHERLLDIFDVDGDGVAEVFSYTQSFEGAGFNVYRRDGLKWANIFEGSNYHCAY